MRHAIRPGDIVAGIAVAGLLIPEGVAYAGIAGLAPSRALAAAIAAGLAYALLGRSRFAIIAPTSSSAAILAGALATLPGNGGARDAMATALVALVGLIFLGLSLLRLGSLSAFVSRPVLRGFAFGLAVTIIVRQLAKLLGIPGVSGTNVGEILVTALQQLPRANGPSVLLGTGTLAAIIGLRRVPQLPGALVALLGGIGLELALGLGRRGVQLAGPIALELPSLALPPPSFALWTGMAKLAAPIALILFAESWGTLRSLALRHGDTISANRELGAIGAANLAAALAQGMPVGAGFSAGSASEAAGARSRLTGAAAALALALLATVAAPLIARIPEPVLAAVVIAALFHALSLAPFRKLFLVRRDPWIAVAAAAGVLGLGVLNGMLLAVGLSLASLLHAFANPAISELGRVSDSHDFVDRRSHSDATPVPGIGIYRPNAPLFFANAETSLAQIAALAARQAGVRTVIVSLEESNDLDSTAAEAIEEFVAMQRAAGRRVVLARTHDHAREVLAASGLVDLAKSATFSVADAVALAEKGE